MIEKPKFKTAISLGKDKSIELTKDQNKELNEAIHFLESDQNAKEIWQKLNNDEKIHITNLLGKAIPKNQDLRINNLYGAIYTLQENKINLLDINSLSSLYTRAEYVNNQNLKKENSESGILEIGKLNSENFPFTIFELKSKAELKKESDFLNHCVGNSDFYINKIREKKIRIFSIRDENEIPKYTIEYDIKSKKITQFKGENNKDIKGKEIIIETLKTLIKNNIEVVEIKLGLEEFLIFENLAYEFIDEKSFLKKVINNEDVKLISREKVDLEGNEDEEILFKLLEIENLNLFLTKLSPELKNKIEYIEGNLIDNSEYCEYKNLTEIGGYAHFWELKSAKGLENLKEIKGVAYFGHLDSFEGLENLLKNFKGDFFCISFDKVRKDEYKKLYPNINFLP